MFKSVDNAQKFGREHFDSASKSLTAVSKSLQALAVDAADYGKKSFESSSAAFEELLGARSLEKAVEIHVDFARTAYEQLIAQTTRFGDTVTDIAKESYKPFEGVLSKSVGR